MAFDHLIILPVLLPLLAGALLLLFDERQRQLKAIISLLSTAGVLAVAILLVRFAAAGEPGMAVYRVGDWDMPFAITLVLDRLSAMMLALTSVLALAAVIFARARWHRAGSHFHSLFQFLLVGLNGAFLTGDLFNLFVFFEVLLAASYGLALHGTGPGRVKAGLHYIAVNLVGSLLLLIGIAMIYGVTGTLNMADLAARIPALDADQRILLEAGAGILGVAFLIKAGMWPLSFWLPPLYAAASAPVAAIFAIMSKVGVYVVLRLWMLVFGDEAGASAQFGGLWLLYGGMATIAFGAVGVLASQNMGRLAGYCVLISSGTLLAVIGAGEGPAIAGALFYLVSSTLAIGAFFLLIELVERGRAPGADVFAVTLEAFGEDEEIEPEDEEVGVAIPATMALLGLAFLGCALLLAGLPPLSGFISKFAMLTALFNPAGLGEAAAVPAANWALGALIVASGLAALIAMTRSGIRTLWVPADDQETPRMQIIEFGSVALLLILCATLVVQAEPVMTYMEDAAALLGTPQVYIQGVMSSGAPVEGGGS